MKIWVIWPMSSIGFCNRVICSKVGKPNYSESIAKWRAICLVGRSSNTFMKGKASCRRKRKTQPEGIRGCSPLEVGNGTLRQPPRADKGLLGLGWSCRTHIRKFQTAILYTHGDSENVSENWTQSNRVEKACGCTTRKKKKSNKWKGGGDFWASINPGMNIELYWMKKV